MVYSSYAPRGSADWVSKLGLEEELKASLGESKSSELIEDRLEEATFSSDQVRELARFDLDWLAALAMPDIFVHNFPPILKAAWQLLLQSVEDGENSATGNSFPQIALGIPRGHAKTTLVKLFCLWCVLFSNKRFILISASTGKLAENILADIMDMLSEPNIIKVFGNWKTGALETNRQDLKKFGFRGRPIILACLGAEGAMRGMNIKNERPDVIVFEDIQTKECSESQVQSSSLERWMVGTAMKAKSPKGCMFIFSGNMYPGPNSLLKKLKTNPTWIKFISGAILQDGTALWPELRNLNSLIAELDNDIAMGHPEIFFSEVLNDTEAGINTSTDLAQIRKWPWNEYELPQGKFIIIDPSSNKVGGDDCAIGYFEVFDGVPALKTLIEENLSPGNTILRALLMALQYNVRAIAVESTAYQFSLLYWFDITAKKYGLTGFRFLEVYTGNYSKNARITLMLKMLTSGEIIIHDAVRAGVMHQIVNWNPLKRDNVDGILDLLTYAPKVLELYGYAVATDAEDFMDESSVAKVVEFNSSF